MSMDMLRQLKIKTSSVQRIRKELRFYEEDAVKEQNRFDQLKASGIDSYRLQQAVSLIFYWLWDVDYRKMCYRKPKPWSRIPSNVWKQPFVTCEASW